MRIQGAEIMIRRGNRHVLNFTPKQVDLLKFLRDYLAGVGEFNPFKGVFLLGRNGTGKTLILLSFIELIKRISGKTGRERTIKHFHAKDLLDLLEFKKEDPNFFRSARSYYIEDIGKEVPEVKDYGTPIRPLPDFIDSIYSISTGWHFLCSNYKIDEPKNAEDPGGKLFQMYGKTITGRLIEMFNCYVLAGEDMRK
jgi:hypothetical protein